MNRKFFLSFGLLLITIPSVIFADYADCEQVFRTTECSTCQKTLYEFGAGAYVSGVKLSQCPASLNLEVIIAKEYERAGYNNTPSAYDLEPVKKAYYKYCDQGFHCDQKEIDNALERIKEDCAYELTIPLNLSADPRTLDFNALITRTMFLYYYTGIPSRETICLKNGKGGFCRFDLLKKLLDYIKKISNGNPNVVLTLDGKTLILPDGTRKPIPQDLSCNKCGNNIAKILFDFITEHRLDHQLEQTIFGGYDRLKYEYTHRCKHIKRNVIGDKENKRGVKIGNIMMIHPFLNILT